MRLSKKKSRRLFFRVLVLAVGWVVFGSGHVAVVAAQSISFEKEPINYRTAEVNDPVAKLIAKLESGEVKLEFDAKYGYLKSVLDALDIPISSQALVFSKTSLQVHHISPQRPRAVYFNDDVYVGWCQNGDVVELGATDPQQGAVFYAIKQEPQPERKGGPEIIRDQGQCIVCHASSRTQNVPGYLIRSVFPNQAGHANFGSGTYTTSATSPFEQRWGGWYVTGKHGQMQHMGNKIFERHERDLEKGANLETLEGLISTKPYLSPHSDLVSLMVMEHQTQMHNAITFANFETRQALHQSYTMNKILERGEGFVSESAVRRIKAAAERVVEHLLMCDEFQLESPVSGTSEFVKEFEARGKRDSQNRSLRDFDLQARMFRYPCSYLIYSSSFDGLPEEVKVPIIDRLHEILEGRDKSEEYSHLSAETRTEILEILRDTQADFSSKKSG